MIFYKDDNRLSMRGEGLDECGPWDNLIQIGVQASHQRQPRQASQSHSATIPFHLVPHILIRAMYLENALFGKDKTQDSVDQ